MGGVVHRGQSVRILNMTKQQSKAKDAGLVPQTSIQQLLKEGHLRFEKCELKAAEEAFKTALNLSKNQKRVNFIAEALDGLLRCAGEDLDDESTQYWDSEINALISSSKSTPPPIVWFSKGVVTYRQRNWKLAQKYFHKHLNAVRDRNRQHHLSESEKNIAEARALGMLARVIQYKGQRKRARWLIDEALRRYESMKLRGINGSLYLTLGFFAEENKNYISAHSFYQKAHASFMEEHNWYYHIYVLYGYARLARLQKNYEQALWYLELIERASSGPGFGVLKQSVEKERKRLAQDSVDLFIDSNKGVVKVKDGREISLRKQYVLMDILKALSKVQDSAGTDLSRGLSKAEIIKKVWNESYRPEAHDNKLYYNINRLRRLIEPDVHQPRYLLNWKEGYCFAPGLQVHFVGNENLISSSEKGGMS